MTFSTTRRVEFSDTDAAGIAHFSAFFPMMEAAEHEMLRSLGISVMPKQTETGAPPVSWPRVSASCNYHAAAHFEDLLRIDVRVAKIGSSSVQYHFRFTRDSELIAEGTLTTVCCQMGVGGRADHPSPHSGGMAKVPIPDAIRQLLARHQ